MYIEPLIQSLKYTGMVVLKYRIASCLYEKEKIGKVDNYKHSTDLHYSFSLLILEGPFSQTQLCFIVNLPADMNILAISRTTSREKCSLGSAESEHCRTMELIDLPEQWAANLFDVQPNLASRPVEARLNWLLSISYQCSIVAHWNWQLFISTKINILFSLPRLFKYFSYHSTDNLSAFRFLIPKYCWLIWEIIIWAVNFPIDPHIDTVPRMYALARNNHGITAGEYFL